MAKLIRCAALVGGCTSGTQNSEDEKSCAGKKCALSNVIRSCGYFSGLRLVESETPGKVLN